MSSRWHKTECTCPWCKPCGGSGKHTAKCAHYFKPGMVPFNKRPIEQVLAELQGSTATNSRIRTRLVKDGTLQEICDECGVGANWQGKPLTLQLEHKDGNRANWVLNNLRLLCPNCHTQTESYGWKGARKKRGTGVNGSIRGFQP